MPVRSRAWRRRHCKACGGALMFATVVILDGDAYHWDCIQSLIAYWTEDQRDANVSHRNQRGAAE